MEFGDELLLRSVCFFHRCLARAVAVRRVGLPTHRDVNIDNFSSVRNHSFTRSRVRRCGAEGNPLYVGEKVGFHIRIKRGGVPISVAHPDQPSADMQPMLRVVHELFGAASRAKSPSPPGRGQARGGALLKPSAGERIIKRACLTTSAGSLSLSSR